jgi:hypothetical protein
MYNQRSGNGAIRAIEPEIQHEESMMSTSRNAEAAQVDGLNPRLAATEQNPEVLRGVLLQLGVEPSLTVREAAAILRWSYWKARRYFSQVDGICLSHRPKRFKRAYRTFTIPVSVFAREWQKMTGQLPESLEVIRQRVALIIRK